MDYLVFVLGYDLLHDKLVSAKNKECDTVYDICRAIADDFMWSEYEKDISKSRYDALIDYLNDGCADGFLEQLGE